MVLVCAPDHPFAARGAVPVEELQGAELVGFDEDLKIRREIDRALAAVNVETRVVMQFDNIETIKRAIEIGAGVSLLPEPTIDREVALKTLIGVPVAGVEMTRPIGLLVRRGKVLGRTAKRFLQLLLSDASESVLADVSDFEISEEDDDSLETRSLGSAVPRKLEPSGEAPVAPASHP